MSTWAISASPAIIDGRLAAAVTDGKKRKHESFAFGLVWLMAFAIPWGDMVLLPYEIQASRVFTVISGAVWFALLWKKQRVRNLESAHWWMILFILWAGALALFAQEPERTLRRTLSYCQLFLDAWLVYQCANTLERYRKLLFAFVLGCGVALAGELYHFLLDISTGDGRFTAPGFDPNDLAVTLVLGIPVAWSLSLRKNLGGGWFRWSNRLYVACGVVGCLLTASRGALVTLAVALLFPLFSLRRSSIRILLSSAVIFLASAAIIFLLWSDVWTHRLSTIFDQLSARDLNGRVDIWQRGFSAFQEHPFIGVGAGSFGVAIGGRRGGDLAAHNTPLGILVEHGLIGLTLFSGIVVSLFRRTMLLQKTESFVWLILILAWLVAAMSLSWENREITWLLWGLCLASPAAHATLWHPIASRPGGFHAR